MADDTKDRTLWCGNLHEDVTEELLYELFIQGGPLDQVKIPMYDGRKKNFAFITFRHVESVPYSRELMSDVRLCGQALRLQFRSGSIHEYGNRPNFQQQPQSEPPPSHHRMKNMQPRPLMAPPPLVTNQAGFSMNAFNPLRPPMGAVLQGTNFHRSYSSPEFSPGQFVNPLMAQNQGRAGGDGGMSGGRGGQREFSPSPRQDTNSRGYPPHDKNHSRKRSHDDRSRGSPVVEEDPYSRRDHRSGDNYRDRSREDRRGRDSDRHDDRRDPDCREDRRDSDSHRDSGRRTGDGGSVRSGGREAPVDPRTLASQNFRRQMFSPTWQRSTPPWEQ